MQTCMFCWNICSKRSPVAHVPHQHTHTHTHTSTSTVLTGLPPCQHILVKDWEKPIFYHWKLASFSTEHAGGGSKALINILVGIPSLQPGYLFCWPWLQGVAALWDHCILYHSLLSFQSEPTLSQKYSTAFWGEIHTDTPSRGSDYVRVT